MQRKLQLIVAAALALSPAVFAQKNQTGEWGGLINWPHIPVAVAQLADGRIVTWASTRTTTFPAGETLTYAAIYDPATGTITQQNNLRHDMFCAGIASTTDGRVIASGGGATVKTTSFFGMNTRWNQNWVKVGDMFAGRWYNTSVTMPNNTILTLWGGNTYGELFNAATGQWTQLTGINPSATADPNDGVDDDNNWYPHLHVAPDGRVFMAGPLKTMRYLNLAGAGSMVNAGTRTPDVDRHRKLGFSVMYRPGKILFTGGRDDRYNPSVTNTAVIIDINGATPVTTSASNMNYARAFHYNVMLPNGEVFAVGGNTSGVKFSDNGGVLIPEMWNPDANIWRTLPQMAVPRGYHMTALLMRDGRVLVGGGGLCGCAADHQNAQIYTPGYLFNADGSAAARPSITNAPANLNSGATFTLNGSDDITRFTMIRLQGTTHGLDSDQRYLAVASSKTGAGQYSLTLESNVNVMIPGIYWIYGLNAAGVPSVGYPVHVHASGANDNVNLAKGKPATQSSIFETAAASRAVDGNQNGDYALGSVTHTNSDSQAYWQVDLGASANISEVVLWNRVDCCGDRTANVHVLVSDQPFAGPGLAQVQSQAGVTDLRLAGAMPQTGRFAVNRTGRYVRVQLEGVNFLSLAEVEVLGTPGAPPPPVNVAPTVSVAAPTPLVAPATIDITANAADADGNLARVEFFNGSTLLATDTTAPFAYSWTNVAAGTYTITARAVDTAGLSASASTTVVVNPPVATNNPPTVSISVPSGLTAPATVNLTATASDPDGNLARVEFYNGSTLLGSATTAPYSYSWANVAAGTYTVTAKAIDAAGASASSNATLTVNAAGAVVSTLVHNLSGRCSDIEGGSAAANARAILYDCHGGNNQKFRFQPVAGQTNVFNVVAVHSNLCLTVQNAGTADNTQVVQAACTTANHQRFSVTRQSNGFYRISPLHAPTKAFRSRNGATANLTPIVIFTWSNLGSQRFAVTGLQ